MRPKIVSASHNMEGDVRKEHGAKEEGGEKEEAEEEEEEKKKKTLGQQTQKKTIASSMDASVIPISHKGKKPHNAT